MMAIRKHGARVAYALNAALLAMFFIGVVVSGCGHKQALVTTSTADWQEQLDARKAEVTQLLVQHSQLREFLEHDLYELGGDVVITTYKSSEYSSDIIISDGKLVIPDRYDLEWYEAVKEYEPQIVAVFEAFHCESISLSAEAGNKNLHVNLGNFKIGEDRYYAEGLDYSRDSASEMSVSVFTDWYYHAWLYN